MTPAAPANEVLANAPVVEIVAELRWACGSEAGQFPQVIPDSKDHEELFTRFGEELTSVGRRASSERLLPVQFPLIANQPVYRFNSGPDEPTKTLLQIGPGIFSANGVPPYKDWTMFSPVVQQGLAALEKVKGMKSAPEHFQSLALRYIDAFTPAHTGGRSITEFITDVLGINIQLPAALSTSIGGSWNDSKPLIQLQIPIKPGHAFHFSIGEGTYAGKPAFIMDTCVFVSENLPFHIADLRSRFDSAQKTLSACFKELTLPIRDHLS